MFALFAARGPLLMTRKSRFQSARRLTPSSELDGASTNNRQAKKSFRSLAAGISAYALSVVILSLVFLPWLNRFVEGQFFGVTGDYGTDFFRYALGSVGLIEYGMDPYSDEVMFQAYRDGLIGTNHPNPFYDDQMAGKGFGESPEPIAKGVVSPPFLLLLVYPLPTALGYTLALNSWTVFGLVGTSWIAVAFWRKLMPDRTTWRRIGSHLVTLCLLVFSSFPVLWSALYGQFEVVYFLPLGGAIYLWSFRSESRTTPWIVGLLIAIGGAVKLFPLLFLAYFAWKAFRAAGISPEPQQRHGWLRLPETKVIVSGVLSFFGIGLLTGLILGFHVYVSFLGKLSDLGAEGTGPSMKGNLLAYLNFLPVWLLDPFTEMSGNMIYGYAVLVVLVVIALAWLTRTPPFAEPLTNRQQRIRLLEMTLIVSALPTLLPHWWIYYNVVLILPLLACFAAAREIVNWRIRSAVLGLTAAGFVLSFSYLTTSLLFGAFPGFYEMLINRDAVNAALTKVENDPSLLQYLAYSRETGRPYMAEFEGRVPSLFNLLYGYPGTFFLLTANALALVTLRNSSAVDEKLHGGACGRGNGSTRYGARGWSGRFVIATAVSGVLLSGAAGYAITWEGARRLRRVPPVEFVVDEHIVGDPQSFVDQLLGRCREKTEGQVEGIVCDLLPPSHFIALVAQSDIKLAEAFVRRDRSSLESPGTPERLQALYRQYQSRIGMQYAECFRDGSALDSLAWRYASLPGGLLQVLEQRCHEQNITLGRVETDWRQWQLEFLYEFTWQQSFASLHRRDVVGFVRLVFDHRQTLQQHQLLSEKKVLDMRVQLARPHDLASSTRPDFVYVQQPAFTALSTFAALSTLSVDAKLEQGLTTGTRYIVEELVRRARLAKQGDPAEALAFAEQTVSQIEFDQIVAWWSDSKGLTAVQLLQSLAAAGILRSDQIHIDVRLFQDLSSLSNLVGPR
jgi:hypothetical protein